MIAVSQEFKDAIKSREREIKGYVELINNAVDVTMTATTTYSQTYSSVSNIVDGEPVKLNYGTLDNLPLDGTQLVMDNIQNEKAPFMISPIAGANKEITISLNRTQVNAITIVPQTIKLFWGEPEYKLFSAHIIVNDGNTEVYNQAIGYTNEEININFDSSKYITEIIITVGPSYEAEQNNTTYFAKINQVVLGDTRILKDNNLIDFTIDEEINKLVEETPTNETAITIPRPSENSYLSSMFLQNMNEKAKIIPYIGVVTTNGTEYVKMGEFYFDSVLQNKDKTTTIYGKSIMKQLETELLKDDNETNIFSSALLEQTFIDLMSNYDYEFEHLDYSFLLAPFNIKSEYLIDLLREINFLNSTLFYISRNNKLVMRNIDTTIKDVLTKKELIEDVIPKNISKINTLIYKKPIYTTKYGVDTHEVYKETIVLEKNTQYVLCKTSTPLFLGATATQTGGTDISIITQGYYLCFVVITGTIGDEVTITLTSNYGYEEAETISKKSTKMNNEKEAILEYDAELIKKIENINTLNYTPSYGLEFEYNGDPSLEAGDYINVQLEDGTYKPIFIEKNHFKFDGGLEGKIEGVE